MDQYPLNCGCHLWIIPKVVERLLSHPKTDVNKDNDQGLTALYLAASNNHLDVVRLLLRYELGCNYRITKLNDIHTSYNKSLSYQVHQDQ